MIPVCHAWTGRGKSLHCSCSSKHTPTLRERDKVLRKHHTTMVPEGVLIGLCSGGAIIIALLIASLCCLKKGEESSSTATTAYNDTSDIEEGQRRRQTSVYTHPIQYQPSQPPVYWTMSSPTMTVAPADPQQQSPGSPYTMMVPMMMTTNPGAVPPPTNVAPYCYYATAPPPD